MTDFKCDMFLFLQETVPVDCLKPTIGEKLTTPNSGNAYNSNRNLNEEDTVI